MRALAEPTDLQDPPGPPVAATSPRRSRRRLWTWLGIATCVAGAGVTAGIVRLELRAGSINRNEAFAIAMLKRIASAQAQIQASGVIDCDHDDVGEYGFLGELGDCKGVRSDAHGHVGTTMVLPRALTGLGPVVNRRVVASGYVFQVFLPASDGSWVAENAGGGGLGAAVDPPLAAKRWLCYAWPERFAATGRRCFFIDQGAELLGTSNQAGRFSGDAGPTPGVSAFRPCAVLGECPIAANSVDALHFRWNVI